MVEFKYILPIPPSVNALYAGKSRRYKSKRYKAWLKECAGVIKRPPSLRGKVRITYDFFAKNMTFGDTSNYTKAALDYLVAAGVIADDNHKIVVEEIIRFAGYDKKNPRVEIGVFPVDK